MTDDPVSVLAELVADDGWLVGGAVRDRLLGRPTGDFDVTLRGPVGDTARRLAQAAGAFCFELSDTFGGWRVVAHDRSWQVDLLPLDGAGIEQDLRRRDLTINAIALPLGGGEHLDPTGGLTDIERGLLRAVAPDAFDRDPLRTLRLARLAAELGFTIEPATLAAARAAAPGLDAVAPERVFEELKRVICGPRPLPGLQLMDQVGATAAVLPELAALHGVDQNRYHHLDVADHTRLVLAETIALCDDPARIGGVDAGALEAHLRAPLGNELTRGQALRFGALLHDIAKPQTQGTTAEGRITFIGHDEAGARLADAILGRLRAGERLRRYVAALTRDHLRLGFLVHRMPLDRRAVYDYLHATEPVAIDVTLLSVADRLATRGDNAERAIARHLELARQLLGEALAWTRSPPRPPVRGDELAAALGVRRGPVIGRLLAELTAAGFSGEVHGADEAITYARSLLASGAGNQ